MSDTWGMSGPTFLLLYGIVALVAFATAVSGRRAVLREHRPPLQLAESDPYLLAYLDGGAQRVVETAVIRLRVLGLLEPTAEPGRWVIAGEPALSHQVNAVEGAVLDGVGQGVGYQWLGRHPSVAAQVEALRSRAEQSHAVLPDALRARARAASWPVAAPLALGLARLFAGMSNGRPVGWLVLALLGTVAGGGALLVVPRTHPGLTGALSELRRRHDRTKRPSSSGPELATAAAFGVALYGFSGVTSWGLLTSAEEEQLAAARQAATGSADSGGGGGSGGGDGGSGGGDGGGGGGCGGCGG